MTKPLGDAVAVYTQTVAAVLLISEDVELDKQCCVCALLSIAEVGGQTQVGLL